MKIFIGCSSSNDISVEYKVVTKYLAEQISKDNDLVFGSVDRGLMGICYNEFLKNNRSIIGICYEMYKDELEGLKLDKVCIVKTLEESTKTLEQESDIIIFLPGAFGTLSEIMYIIESKRTKLHNKEIVIFNINGFYDELIDMYNKINIKISKNYNFNELCNVFNSADEIVNYLKLKKSSN